MANYSLKETLTLINQQVASREILSMQLLKAKALVDIALGDNFLLHSNSMIHTYLLVLSDIVEGANTLNEESLNALLKDISLNAYE